MQQVAKDEATFLAEYDPTAYPAVAASVDVVVLTIRDGSLCALLVEREHEPFRGWWALPGTFLRPDEDADYAVLRSVANKTGVLVRHAEQLRTYTLPERDPRMRVVSVAYLSFGPVVDTNDETHPPLAGVQWCPVFAQRVRLAFDHQSILIDAVERAQNKIEYSTLAPQFLSEEFTIGELMGVYETVWNRPINKPNFYRKVKASKGFLIATGEMRGKTALYRAGDAQTLFPPIRREIES